MNSGSPFNGRLWPLPGVCHQRGNEHHQKNYEENFCDPTRRASDSREAEHAGHYGHEQKD